MKEKIFIKFILLFAIFSISFNSCYSRNISFNSCYSRSISFNSCYSRSISFNSCYSRNVYNNDVKPDTMVSIKRNIPIMLPETLSIDLNNIENHEISTLKEEIDIYPSNSLYANIWNTNRAHIYSSLTMPSNYDIDLSNFSMPIKSKVITSNFGYRPRFKRYHKGLDIKGAIGDTIYAAFDGKVRVVRYEPNGYGNFIVIRHHNGLETIYGHLSKHLVKVDQYVKAGEPIGLCGNTGRSFGTHLHFETRLCGQAIDPAELFNIPGQHTTCDIYRYTNMSIALKK